MKVDYVRNKLIKLQCKMQMLFALQNDGIKREKTVPWDKTITD